MIKITKKMKFEIHCLGEKNDNLLVKILLLDSKISLLQLKQLKS